MTDQKQNISIELKKLWNKQAIRMTIGAIMGAIVGLLYWNFIGCNNGTCPLTNTPYKTVGIFTVMGLFFIRKSPDKRIK